jgi:hypothetical protein
VGNKAGVVVTAAVAAVWVVVMVVGIGFDSSSPIDDIVFFCNQTQE